MELDTKFDKTFSIAIPAYKGKYLTECIESILTQTYKNFELIVINDFSPDPIDEIVKRFNDPRISYFTNKVNIGAKDLVVNWNNCLEKATGEYFIMMGDDDKMEPEYLEEFIHLFKDHPNTNVYHCRSIIIDENSTPITLTPSWPNYETVYDTIWHRVQGLRLHYVSDFVYKTSALKKAGGFFYTPLAWAADDITAYIATSEQGIAHTNKPVFNYRETSYTISSTGKNELKMDAVIIEENWMLSFLKNIPKTKGEEALHSHLKTAIPRYIKIKKKNLIIGSFNSGAFNYIAYWYKERKKYRVSIKDIFKAFIYFLYKNLTKKRQ
jgi:glycosyltransferase involved in cell wall biosynthesis